MENKDNHITNILNSIENDQIEKGKKDDETIQDISEIKVQGRHYELKDWYLFDGKLKVVAPEPFFVMDEKSAKIKFPSQDRPEFILTDTSTAINITVTDGGQSASNSDLEEIRDTMIKMMTRINPGINVSEKDTYEDGDKKLCYFRFSNNTIDGKLTNIMTFMVVNKIIKIVNFSAPTQDFRYWNDGFFKLMKAIEILN